MAKVTICFTLPKNVAKELDKCAASMGMNRSAFLEWLLTKSLPIVPSMQKVLDSVFKAGLDAQKKALE
jgi:metal-responsive CopG/Arc/MetJ family transcriptional regulator